MLDQIQEAAHLLRQGKIIIFPTATVYSLGASIFHSQALKELQAMKASSLPDPLPIMINKFSQATTLAYIGDNDLEILKKLWPGPTTVLLPKKASLAPELVDRERRIALRFSNNTAGEIIQEAGFVITGLPAFSYSGFPIVQPEEIDLEVSLTIKGICQFAELSTIVDLTNRTILREGADVEKVKKVLQLKN
jgi:L-threonylcarbamoyladenylate synthase